MKIPALFSVLVLGLAASAFAAQPPPTDAVVIEHGKVDTFFGKGGSILANSKYQIMAGRRTGPGLVEIHNHDTDIFYVTEGTATLITGGNAVDAKEASPGEMRAEKIEGGTTREITKGDIVVIPAGVPHWMPKVTKPFVYFVVKVTTN